MLTHTYDLKWLLDRRTDTLVFRLRRFSYKRQNKFALARSMEIGETFGLGNGATMSGGYIKHPEQVYPSIGLRLMELVASAVTKRTPTVQAYLADQVIKTFLGQWADASDDTQWTAKATAVFHVYDRVNCILVSRS